MDMNISHTAGYGNTLVWMPGDQPGMGEQLVHARMDLDLTKFHKILIDSLSRPSSIAAKAN